MVRSFLLTLASATLSAAHFRLDWPPTAGFIDDSEPESPCGGATVTVDGSAPEVQVDQFAVEIFSSHPTGSWSFFATTNTEAPYNFTEIVPVVNSTGIGEFCLTNLRAPSGFAGKSGVLQVIDTSVDGTLYQCAPVRFVEGSNSTAGPACKNATGFSAEWTSMEASSSSESPSSTSDMSSMSGSATAEASSSSSAAAAMVTGMGSVVGLSLLAAGVML